MRDEEGNNCSDCKHAVKSYSAIYLCLYRIERAPFPFTTECDKFEIKKKSNG